MVNFSRHPDEFDHEITSAERAQRKIYRMKIFLGFVLISGTGWILDFLSFSVLTQFFDVSPAKANSVSSMIGVTYVWFVALKRVFDRGKYGGSRYLLIYWGYQFISISLYSLLISIFATSELNYVLVDRFAIPSDLASKIVLTAPNLLTNFVFMKFLTRFMKSNA